ncbi:MAG: alpha/beta fold hydrolase [Pseudomonadota bacterium]
MTAPTSTAPKCSTQHLAAALLRALLLAAVLATGGCTSAPSLITAATESPTPAALTVNHDGLPFRVWYKPRTTDATRGAILLLHGRTWSSRPDFDLQVDGEPASLMDGLTALGFDTYALDARGYGETPRDPSGWLTPHKARDDALAIVRWLKQRPGTQPLYLFGWSYGSLVAQLVVQTEPELLNGWIAFGYPLRDGSATTPPAVASAAAPPRRPTTAAAAAEDFIVPGTISPATIDAFVAQALATDPVRTDWRELEQWRDLDPTLIDRPTLLIEGALDPIAVDAYQAQLFTAIPHSDKRWVVLPHADHAGFLETSRAEFLKVIDAFTSPARTPKPRVAP